MANILMTIPKKKKRTKSVRSFAFFFNVKYYIRHNEIGFAEYRSCHALREAIFKQTKNKIIFFVN